MKKAALFVRVSKKSQNYNRQIADLEKYAGRMGFKVVSTIAEKISGIKSNEDRNGISELRKLAKSGKIEVVIINEVSRLGRNPIENLKLLHELHNFKVSILSQDIGIPTLNNEGKPSMICEILYTVYSSLARQEREKMIERIESGLEEARRRGVKLGRPEGSSLSDENFLKKYKKVVKSLEQKISIRDVAKLHGVSKFTVEQVKKVLSKTAHFGSEVS